MQYALIVPVTMIKLQENPINSIIDDLGGKVYGFKSNVGVGNVDSVHNLLFLVGFKRFLF